MNLFIISGLIACTPEPGSEDPTSEGTTEDTETREQNEYASPTLGQCGFTTGFGAPVSETLLRDDDGYNYYNSRGFYAYSSSTGYHLGLDIDADEGTEVRAGVTGTVVDYRSADGYGTRVAIIAVDIYPPLHVVNGAGDTVEVERFLTIYGHIRNTSEKGGGGESVTLSPGDCVTPDTRLGWIEYDPLDGVDDATNGDGERHLHYGIRLQDVDTAIATNGNYMDGYDDGSLKGYYADPETLLDRTLDTETWAEDAVDDLNDIGVLSENSDGYEDRLTWNRAELAAVMSRALELEEECPVYDNCSCPFDDVQADDDWFAPDVCTLTWLDYGDGISPFRNQHTSGDEDAAEFNPGHMLTREQFLKVLVESYGWEKVEDSDVSFEDLDEASESLLTYIHTAYEQGIISDAETFRPGEIVSLGEIAVMVDRAIDSYGQPTPDEDDFSDDPNSQCTGGW